MSIDLGETQDREHGQGPKYWVNIEGKDYPWDHETITVPEIRNIGHLPENMPVLEINLEENTERTIPEGETVVLKPGHGFSKKIKYQRG